MSEERTACTPCTTPRCRYGTLWRGTLAARRVAGRFWGGGEVGGCRRQQTVPCVREEPPDHEGHGDHDEVVTKHRLGCCSVVRCAVISFAAPKAHTCVCTGRHGGRRGAAAGSSTRHFPRSSWRVARGGAWWRHAASFSHGAIRITRCRAIAGQSNAWHLVAVSLCRRAVALVWRIFAAEKRRRKQRQRRKIYHGRSVLAARKARLFHRWAGPHVCRTPTHRRRVFAEQTGRAERKRAKVCLSAAVRYSPPPSKQHSSTNSVATSGRRLVRCTHSLMPPQHTQKSTRLLSCLGRLQTRPR